MPPKKDPKGARLPSVTSAPKTSTTEENVSQRTNNETQEDNPSTSDEEPDGANVGFSPCGKTKKQKFICSGGMKTCGVKIATGDDSVMCDLCHKWFHPRCQGLSTESFSALSRHCEDFLWLCMSCKPNLRTITQLGSDVEKQLELVQKNILQALEKSRANSTVERNIENKISSLEAKLCNEIRDKQTKLEASMNKHESCTKDIKRLFQNNHEKERRERNIILHNIVESKSDNPQERQDHDKEVFMKVTAALTGNSDVDVEKIIRLGKKRGTTEDGGVPRPRLMLIRLKEKDDVDALIKQRTKLRDRGFPNVYLTYDLTPEEREEQKKLRKELEEKGKETHMIFRGRIIKRQ